MKDNHPERVAAARFRWMLLAGAAGAMQLALYPRLEPSPDLPRVSAEISSAGLNLAPPASVEKALQKLPLYFVENQGQADPRVVFYLQGRETDIYFTRDGVTFALTEKAGESGFSPAKRWTVKLDFLDANPEAKPAGEDETGAKMSYFRGDPADWKTGVPTYAGVVYRQLWPGIDLVYTGTEGHLKYTFTVEPGADPSRIRLAYRGATTVRPTEEGRLAVSTPIGGFEDDRPIAYQDIEGERIEVSVAYALEEADGPEPHRYGFQLGPYDETKPLFLDPVFLTYTGYIGGTSTESGNGVAVDGSGNAYVTGWANSTHTTFPVTVGPDTTHNGATDAFVAKVKADGTGLDYCGYIGGSGSDFGNRIAVDSSGNAYVSGETLSSNLPVSGGPGLTFGGVRDAFVAKVKFDGTGLDYCGYIGGSQEDAGGGIAVDSSGNAYVTGRTASNETTHGFPVLGGPDLTYNGGTQDVFVAKLNSTGAFVYLGYIGGSGNEWGMSLAVESGSAYLTGVTTSADFPVTGGPDLTANGLEDAFVAKVDPTGSSLTYCGYIGGSDNDQGQGIAVDSSGYAYVSGRTASDTSTENFPALIGPDLSYNGGFDSFMAKIDSTGSSLVYCGYIGGSGDEVLANDAAIDGAGNAYTVGFTSSADLPVIRGPDLTYNGGWDAYVAKVKADGTGLSYCGYIGGSSNDFGNGIAVDSSGNAYLVGETNSNATSFPVHVGPSSTFRGTSEAWVAKIEDTGTTAVELTAFSAEGLDGAVRVEWETASELDNLGFHLYRSLSENGPYERITRSLIPGLGSSPEGARYHYRDSSVANGTAYFYQLEDVETTGSTDRHGPVWATPVAGGGASAESDDSAPVQLIYGNPSAVSVRIAERGPQGMVLELETGGFLAEPLADGSVRLTVPGFWNEPEAGSLAIPVWRSWMEVPGGATVRVISTREAEVEEFSSLRPSLSEASEIVATPQGMIRLARSRARSRASSRAVSAGETARVVSLGYQGEVKKALIELSPLRWDAARGKLQLARRLIVRLSFSGRGREERSRDLRRGRHHYEISSHRDETLLARLRVRKKGLYAVAFGDILTSDRNPLPSSSLALSRLGQLVPFHLEPEGTHFGPGSTLYFFSEGAALNPYGDEAVYELVRGEGEPMAVHAASPWGGRVRFHWQRVSHEENRYYQAALLEAPDLWLWDILLAPTRNQYSFELSGLASSSAASAELEIGLQGASELSVSADHHLRVYVNGVWVAEKSFAGKRAETLTARIPSKLLREGENRLEIENAGDTGADYSMVMLDRFALSYPRQLSVLEGIWEGTFSESGAAELSGLEKGAFLLDVTEKPTWLEAPFSSFRVEAGRTYVAVNASSVLNPAIERPRLSGLKSSRHRADYLILGPRAFLPAARPLLDWRQRQGLRGQMVPIEDIYSEFGFGESRPEAVRDFLSYAYHHWQEPSPRYVLLLGDGTYDFKDYLGTGVKNQVPPWLVKTSFLWTASDPLYAAVNGDDSLPDLAIGRLPARTVREVEALVEKILAYEISGTLSEGPVVLVADNPDSAGDFVANAEDLASGLLAARNPQRIYLDRLGTAATRAAIEDAFDRGASLLSYVGHGGIQLWAQENVFDSARVASLGAQEKQPVVLTLNCLNGYFPFPYFDSLSEELIKAPEKGAIAAISPTGLSLDRPAHLFHRALLSELLSARNLRLGDALLAAQSAYAETGALPELITIYHLLGDPALKIR